MLPGSAVPASGAVPVVPYALAPVEARDLSVCDLDGDGVGELVTSEGIWSGLDLLVPGSAPIAEGLPSPSVCLGDLDGDGVPELAWASPYWE